MKNLNPRPQTPNVYQLGAPGHSHSSKSPALGFLTSCCLEQDWASGLFHFLVWGSWKLDGVLLGFVGLWVV